MRVGSITDSCKWSQAVGKFAYIFSLGSIIQLAHYIYREVMHC